MLLVNTPKGAQEIAQAGPEAFNRIGMHFSDPIAIVIACPFALAEGVTYLDMGSTA